MLALLLNADVYAPRALGHQHLLVAGGKIVWIGNQPPKLDRVLGMQVYDLEGRRLIPGLIDSHAHVTGGGGESGFASRVPPVPLTRFTDAGITTVVGLLGTDDTTRNTATLLAQTRALCEEGLNAYCHTGGYHVPPVTLTGSVRSDIVHIDRIIGVGEIAISDHRSSQPTLDELLRIAADAHVAGLLTGKAGILHLHLGDGKRGLELVRQALDSTELPPRVFNPTHVNRRKALFEEAWALAARGCTIDVTAFPVAADDDAWAADEAVARYLETGSPPAHITVSSDGGGCLPVFNAQGELLRMDIGRPGALLDALGALLGHGIALDVALPAFTSNVASLLRLHQKGIIAVGADADLVVLDETAATHAVMVGGRWHKLDGNLMITSKLEEIQG